MSVKGWKILVFVEGGKYLEFYGILFVYMKKKYLQFCSLCPLRPRRGGGITDMSAKNILSILSIPPLVGARQRTNLEDMTPTFR